MSKETKVMFGILAIVVVGLVGLFLALGRGGDSSTKGPKADTSVLVRPDSHKLGSGKVIVVEFGDYQCPACGVAYPYTKKLIAEYGDKITFVWRNYPLQQHSYGELTAEAAEAAGAQGKFWEMHDKLYETQQEWSTGTGQLDKLVSYAQGLGLDTAKFKADVQANRYKDFIQADVNDGLSLQIPGTPTFFVNGQQTANFQYDTLKSAVEAALKQ